MWPITKNGQFRELRRKTQAVSKKSIWVSTSKPRGWWCQRHGLILRQSQHVLLSQLNIQFIHSRRPEQPSRNINSISTSSNNNPTPQLRQTNPRKNKLRRKVASDVSSWLTVFQVPAFVCLFCSPCQKIRPPPSQDIKVWWGNYRRWRAPVTLLSWRIWNIFQDLITGLPEV